LLLASFQVLFLGSIYTISRKYQNLQLSPGLDGRLSHFHHPVYLYLIQISSILSVCWHGYLSSFHVVCKKGANR
jgi:hypothetical protein